MRKNQMCAGAARADGRMKAILSTKEMIEAAREKSEKVKQETIARFAAVLVDPTETNAYKAVVCRMMADQFERDAECEASK